MLNQNNSNDTTQNIDSTKYVPGSSDKKRAIMMYLFFGIMVTLTKKELNSFEYYHLRQSAGRWILFLLILVFDVVLLFIPVIKYIWLIPLIILVIVRFISVKQARDGKYFISKKESPLALFSSVWTWFIDLFELNVESKSQDSTDSQEKVGVLPPDDIDKDIQSQNKQ